jgi:hypothetical protein
MKSRDTAAFIFLPGVLDEIYTLGLLARDFYTYPGRHPDRGIRGGAVARSRAISSGVRPYAVFMRSLSLRSNAMASTLSC